MMQQCSQCHRVYNDEFQWTICPHNPLEAGPSSGYCRRHDLFEPCRACAAVSLRKWPTWAGWVLVAGVFLFYFLAPPQPQFIVAKCCGIYKKNDAGTYDRFFIWPWKRAEMRRMERIGR